MIPISSPLASEEVSKIILETVKRENSLKKLVTGIRACQKTILKNKGAGIMVLNATTYPMDLITHLPILCENSEVPYIFVKNTFFLNGFTCVLIQKKEGEDIEKILKEAFLVKSK